MSLWSFLNPWKAFYGKLLPFALLKTHVYRVTHPKMCLDEERKKETNPQWYIILPPGTQQWNAQNAAMCITSIVKRHDKCKKKSPDQNDAYWAVDNWFCRADVKASSWRLRSSSMRYWAYFERGLWIPHSVFSWPFQRPERSSSFSLTGWVEW